MALLQMLLPEVLVDVLMEWVQFPQSFAALDIACCSKSARPSLLSLYKHPAFSIRTLKFHADETYCIHAAGCVAWLNSRAVKVDRLVADIIFAEMTMLRRLSAQNAASIRSMRIGDAGCCHSAGPNLVTLLRKCTGLTDLDCSYKGMENNICDFPVLSLRKLSLTGCSEEDFDVSPGPVSAFISRLSASLETLSLDSVVLSATCLDCIASCQKLSDIRLYSCLLPTEALVTKFLSSFPSLTTIHLKGHLEAPASAAFAMNIAQANPHMKELLFSNGTHIPFESLGDILAICPKLLIVKSDHFAFSRSHANSEGEISVLLHAEHRQRIVSIVASSPAPVVTFWCEVAASPADLRGIADSRHAKHLQRMSFLSIEATTDADMSYFLERCTGLVEFRARHCPPSITDISLRAMADHCPLMKQLQFSGFQQFTNDGVLYLARSANLLEHLDITGSTLVTGAVLPELHACCRELLSLQIPSAQFTVQDIQNVIEQDMFPKLRVFTVDDALRAPIVTFLRRLGTVNRTSATNWMDKFNFLKMSAM